MSVSGRSGFKFNSAASWLCDVGKSLPLSEPVSSYVNEETNHRGPLRALNERICAKQLEQCLIQSKYSNMRKI